MRESGVLGSSPTVSDGIDPLSLPEALPLKVGILPDNYDKFSVMPQRGYGLQPRVAASATLGTSKKRDFNRNAVASISQREMHKAVFLTQGSRSGNPGLEAIAPLGHH